MNLLAACLVVSLSAMVIGTAQAGPAATAEEGKTVVSFAQTVVPVLRTQCATCHMTGSEPGNMELYPSAAYDSIVGVESVTTGATLVAPGEPESSYLLHKIKGTHLEQGGTGARMPFAQRPLPEDVVVQIEQWIAQGALNN